MKVLQKLIQPSTLLPDNNGEYFKLSSVDGSHAEELLCQL